jgi:hypothetical protein
VWLFALKKEPKLQVFENEVVKKIFKKDDISEQFRMLDDRVFESR